MKRTAEEVIAIGQDLLAVKERLAHGQFMAWVDTEFGMNHQAAMRFMQVARRFGGHNQQFVDFPVSVLYELAAPSTPDDVIEQVTSGQLPASLPAIREAKAAMRQTEPQSEPEPEEEVPWYEEDTPAPAPAFATSGVFSLGIITIPHERHTGVTVCARLVFATPSSLKGVDPQPDQ